MAKPIEGIVFGCLEGASTEPAIGVIIPDISTAQMQGRHLAMLAVGPVEGRSITIALDEKGLGRLRRALDDVAAAIRAKAAGAGVRS